MPPDSQAVADQAALVTTTLQDAKAVLGDVKANVTRVEEVVGTMTAAIVPLKDLLQATAQAGSAVDPGGGPAEPKQPEELAGLKELKDAYRDALKAYKTDQSNSAKQEAARTAKDALDALTSDESASAAIAVEVDNEVAASAAGSVVGAADPEQLVTAGDILESLRDAYKKALLDWNSDKSESNKQAVISARTELDRRDSGSIADIESQVGVTPPAAELKPPEGGRRTRRSRRPRRSQISRRPIRSRRSRRSRRSIRSRRSRR